MKELRDCKVLIVDDTEMNVDVLVDALYDDYELNVALNGKTALEIANSEKPDIILLDIMMPEMNGYEVCKTLKSNPDTEDIPVIFLTAMTEVDDKAKAFHLGGVDYITKPFEIVEVKERVKTQLSLGLARRDLANQNEILEYKVDERTKELLYTRDAIIEVMARMAEGRDPETGGHITRTKEYVRILTQQLYDDHQYPGLVDSEFIENMYKSAAMHDIGKIGISDSLLLKPGKLEQDEYEVMKTHTDIGYDIICSVTELLDEHKFLNCAMEIAKSHHEKWNGTGYPEHLSGEDIPLSSRIMSVADVYDALISARPYKTAFTHEKATSIILEGKGVNFDPIVVDAFIKASEKFEEVADKYAD